MKPLTTMQREVLAALTDQWSTAKEVHERVGQWCQTSVRSVLIQFAHMRIAETKQAAVRHNRQQQLYRKAKHDGES